MAEELREDQSFEGSCLISGHPCPLDTLWLGTIPTPGSLSSRMQQVCYGLDQWGLQNHPHFIYSFGDSFIHSIFIQCILSIIGAIWKSYPCVLSRRVSICINTLYSYFHFPRVVLDLKVEVAQDLLWKLCLEFLERGPHLQRSLPQPWPRGSPIFLCLLTAIQNQGRLWTVLGCPQGSQRCLAATNKDSLCRWR